MKTFLLCGVAGDVGQAGSQHLPRDALRSRHAQSGEFLGARPQHAAKYQGVILSVVEEHRSGACAQSFESDIHRLPDERFAARKRQCLADAPQRADLPFAAIQRFLQLLGSPQGALQFVAR